MGQYFESNDSLSATLHVFKATVNNVDLEFKTDSGVFAKDGIDLASKMLVEETECKTGQKILDLGCGYGFIGIYFAKKYLVDVVMIDISSKACELAKINANLNKIEAKIINFDSIPAGEKDFDLITLNPPIHAGKQVIFGMYNDAFRALKSGGKFNIIINKKHGYASHKKELEAIFSSVEDIRKDKGFHILRCTK